ncbi:uncharacterized protein LOC133901429 [Phragmites australis]|uniref:uncharacterized protein LOC133901429 n=1 Tax=Phragmites australis TaxID=29695 RepID=UPI002D7734FF|nr:uncharacterized protein LOC133901429 [Phragmites australis]
MEGYKPCAAMVVTQCIYAALALWAKAAFTGGMSPTVFVVYRQAVATVVLLPIVIVANRRKMKEMMSPGVVGFSLVFVASLIGATVNQFLYYQGVHLGSSSMASAMTNLIPAITFVMAASVGLERVDVRRPRSLAKIFGTVVCVGGAMVMAFFKGPQLHSDLSTLHSSAGSRWVMGALFLVGSSSCWSLWLILQVPICKSYVDPLTLSAWMCLLSTLQSALLVSFLLPDPIAWRIHSLFDLSSCLFAGVFGSGVTFYLQSWCISVKGPLYSAMFNPLCTVITTAVAAAVLREELHVGSLLGAIAVVAGLYVVLWGRAGDGKTGRAPEHADDMEKTAVRSDSQLDVGNGIAEPLLQADGDPTEKYARLVCPHLRPRAHGHGCSYIAGDRVRPARPDLVLSPRADLPRHGRRRRRRHDGVDGAVRSVRGDGGGAAVLRARGRGAQDGVRTRHAPHRLRRLPPGHRRRHAPPRVARRQGLHAAPHGSRRAGLRPPLRGIPCQDSATGQYFYLQGLHLASPSMARATTNLAPGITFAIAAVIGLEKVELSSVRSVAKIVGTVICLGGAAFMAFFKGPKLLGALLLSEAGDWVKGGIYLVGNAVCVSVWYILQVPVCRSYLDPLSLATWMCVLATLQCAVMAFFLEPNYMEIWRLTSFWEFPCILYGGVFASGANFFLQSWCISVKGPLYSAIFTPLSAVITAILSVLFLHEELYVGSILGAVAIIVGLYGVLWGKADDAKSERLAIHSSDTKRTVDAECIGVRVECRTDISEPLLSENAGR